MTLFFAQPLNGWQKIGYTGDMKKQPQPAREKHRRSMLNLTIEEAASKAGVGTKTWSRYEAGGSIRKDKSKGICKPPYHLSLEAIFFWTICSKTLMSFLQCQEGHTLEK